MNDVAQRFTGRGQRRWSKLLRVMGDELERVVLVYDSGTAEQYGKACIAFDDKLSNILDQAAAVQPQTLTDEQIAEIAERCEASDPADSFWRAFARDVLKAAAGVVVDRKASDQPVTKE